jgi:hypothetical protein
LGLRQRLAADLFILPSLLANRGFTQGGTTCVQVDIHNGRSDGERGKRGNRRREPHSA